ncbi:MAG TPA: bacillithiol biosynthesis BshC [Thermoanaerobaculia bacterium]|jgi:uncharacterized protein YllA (UPF0747 family)
MRVPLSQYPGFNRFTLDWLAGDDRFLPRRGADRQGRRAVDAELVAALKAQNRQWGIDADADIDAWATGDAVMLIAGQQLGFAGGPLYTLAKIATLLKMKRQYASEGKKAVAFFWLASEDHDWDEAAALSLPVAGLCVQKQVNRQVDLVCMRAIRSADQRAAVGSLPVPESLIGQLLSLYDLPRPSWLRPGINFRDSFAELLASVFGNELVLIDALTPELRRAGLPLFQQIGEKHDHIQDALHDRAKELAAAGYAQQIVPPDGEHYTLFFELDAHGVRHPVTRPVEAERTSTSALTRPLLQDQVLQPDVFVGGPSEVAYYAQLVPLYEMLGVAMPRVALRGHALVAPKRVARAIERYDIEPHELFASADALLIEREPEGVSQIRDIAESARANLMQHIEQISQLALPADHSLAGSIQRSIGHLEYHFNKLSERAIKGLVRKDRERLAAVRELAATLHPDAHVQDRVVGWFGYWSEYGQHLTQCLIDEIEPDSDVFRIVSL